MSQIDIKLKERGDTKEHYELKKEIYLLFKSQKWVKEVYDEHKIKDIFPDLLVVGENPKIQFAVECICRGYTAMTPKKVYKYCVYDIPVLYVIPLSCIKYIPKRHLCAVKYVYLYSKSEKRLILMQHTPLCENVYAWNVDISKEPTIVKIPYTYNKNKILKVPIFEFGKRLSLGEFLQLLFIEKRLMEAI